jgi:hypothetical protein
MVDPVEVVDDGEEALVTRDSGSLSVCAIPGPSRTHILSGLAMAAVATMTVTTNDVLAAPGGGKIKSKNQLRRAKAKQKRATTTTVRATLGPFRKLLIECESFVQAENDVKKEASPDVKPKDEDVDMSVEYVSERLDVSDAALEAFSDVFARFQLPPESTSVRLALCLGHQRHLYLITTPFCRTRRTRRSQRAM